MRTRTCLPLCRPRDQWPPCEISICYTGLWGLYKRSEPIKSLHSVQNHMANVYSSKVCLQTKNFPKFLSFFFSKNTPKYDKLSKISNISIKTILELWTKFRNFGNFGHILDRLQTIHNTCSNLIGSEPLYILPTDRLRLLRTSVKNKI